MDREDASRAARRTTVVSPSNIAFIKYWGARDLERAIPENASLSMTLRTCHSRCTVAHRPDAVEHEVRWRGQHGFELAPPSFADRVRRHLDRLRAWAGCGGAFQVATENSFPAAAGLASSASGFSALTLAVLGALDRQVSPAEQSSLARASGSGSAARSVFGGYVQWPAPDAEDSPVAGSHPGDQISNYAFQVAPASHWDLRDVIAVVETSHKEVSSLDGHRRARTSPYFEARQAALPARLEGVREALLARDFQKLGEIVELEAVDLHCVAMTSRPAIFYWKPATLSVLEAVRGLRREGIGAWSTLDAGANVHVICQPADEDAVADRLAAVPGIDSILRDGVGDGPSYQEEHLF
jgi:diphosphomevalonate decarboxylase